MDPLVHDARMEGGPERDVNLLIEKGFLLLGSIEFQIEEHLLAHGTRIDPETRFFMAQVRDAAGDAAAKLLDEARNRIEAAPAEQAPQGSAAEATVEAAPRVPLPAPVAATARRGTTDRRRRRVSARAAVVNAAFATACAAVLLTLLLDAPASEAPQPSAAQAEAVLSGGEERIAILTPATHPAEREPAKASRPSTSITKIAQTAPRPLGSEIAMAAPRPSTHPAERGTVAKRAPWTVTAAIADGRSFPPYPDPLDGIEPTWPAPLDPEAEAEAEYELGLSRSIRREVQRRLALAEFDPQLFDGIFGPATRDALVAWQRAAGLPPTGYLDEQALALLREQTQDGYRAWRAARERARQEESRTVVLTSPVPPASPARPDRCERFPSGKIVYGQGVRCDFRGLRENLARFFG